MSEAPEIPETPLNFLWRRLAELLPTQDYLALQIEYAEQRRRYTAAAELRARRKELARWQKLLPGVDPSRRAWWEGKIARRVAWIARAEQADET